MAVVFKRVLCFILKVDGGFSEWSNWTTCSVSCGSGFQLRYRNCTSPLPAHGGKSCESRNFTDVRTCLMGACNLPGNYVNVIFDIVVVYWLHNFLWEKFQLLTSISEKKNVVVRLWS